MQAAVIDGVAREVGTVAPQRTPIRITDHSLDRWLAATANALRAAEASEAKASAEYNRIKQRAEAQLEAARAVVREKRQAVALLRQVLDAVRPAAPGRALAAPVPLAAPSDDAGWHPRFKQCGGCGTTDAAARPHYARGHCRPCAVSRWPERYTA